MVFMNLFSELLGIFFPVNKSSGQLWKVNKNISIEKSALPEEKYLY